MRLNDAVWGALVLLLSAAIFFAIRNFPTIPGQAYGPALFPGVIASGLLLCGIGLVYKGLAARRAEWVAWLAWDPWIRSRRHVVAFFVVVGINVLYIVLVERLGFIVMAAIYLAALFTVFRVRGRLVLPLAIAVTLVIHYAFYELLHVPLPWGILERVAW